MEPARAVEVGEPAEEEALLVVVEVLSALVGVEEVVEAPVVAEVEEVDASGCFSMRKDQYLS